MKNILKVIAVIATFVAGIFGIRAVIDKKQNI